MSPTLSFVTESAQLHLDINWPSPSTVRVAVVGEVDLATAHVLRDRLLSVLREQAPAVIDVDLAGVTFLDCAAIRALVTVRNAAIEAGHQIWVSHPQPIVRRVLDVTGMLDVFTAPIDQAQHLRTGSGHQSTVRSAPATATQPPRMMAAA